MSKETGGSAFPWVEQVFNCEKGERTENYGDCGMSLRDYLAAKAMASIPLALDDGEQKLIANAAYRQADAMLRARASNS